MRLDWVTDDDFEGVSPLADVTDDEDLSLCEAIRRPISESLALKKSQIKCLIHTMQGQQLHVQSYYIISTVI